MKSSHVVLNLKKINFFLFLFIISLYGIGQTNLQTQPGKGDTALVNNLLQQSKDRLTDNPALAISLAFQAKSLAEKIDFPKGAATALKNIGLGYRKQGNNLDALENYNLSLKIFEQLGDNASIANLYNNIGVVYYKQGDDARALENYLQSLKFSELAGDKFRVLIALNNIGGIYSDKKATYDKALEYYLKAFSLSEELGKKEESGGIAVNIGSIYFNMQDDAKALLYFDKSLKAYGKSDGSLEGYNALGKLYRREAKYDLALKNHNQALAIAQKANDKTGIIKSFRGLGDVYKEKGDYKTAIAYYKEAEIPGVEIQALHELKDLYKDMAKAYEKSKDPKNAFKYSTLYSNVKDTLYDIETDKKLGSLQFDFDLQKKQNEIVLLTKDKDLQAVTIKKQEFAKNAFMIGLLLAFTIALLIFRSYRLKAKTHKIVNQQKNEIEHLLLNILPTEVAHELKTKGRATPRQYESVSVMFTDFKGFTTIADKMPPDDLVKELDDCFIAFDGIIEKYNLEKIKTIGDSYMCAGGIPTPDETHVLKIVKAGLEIQQYVATYNERRQENGLEPWLVRIGIHVGPVVAGVVGKKKYAYDIWGSTVNIASRMESNGEPGKVNISSATYELIKDYYECSHRGKISAKNVGEIDMYFIEHEYTIPKTLLLKEDMEVQQ
jgi:class 3 adenylate cyclase/tetratricopeptide (TPR) repeat protein